MSKPPAPPPMGHNKDAVDAAREAQTISYVTKLREHISNVKKLSAPVTAAKEAMNAHVKMAGAAGIPAKLLKELATDGSTSRKDLSKAEKQRREARIWLGLPVGDDENPELPTAAKDEIYYDGEGYQAGMRGDEPKPPMEVPAMFISKWMEGWHTGDAKRKWADQTTAATEAAAAPPPKAAPAAREMTPAEKRKAEKDEEAKAKAGLDALSAIGEAEPELVAQVVADHGADNDFEAKPEELAAQAGRPARATETEEMV